MSNIGAKDDQKESYDTKERAFSLQLNSRSALQNASLGLTGKREEVLVEGSIGILKSAKFLEEQILEVRGTDGVLRLDLSREELQNEHVQSLAANGGVKQSN